MRAVVLQGAGVDPVIGTFEDPVASDERVVIDVAVAGVNPVDLQRASAEAAGTTVPSVVGREGVGRLGDGRRVYFNPSIDPYGSWAERTLVAPERTFPIPDGLDDALAVAMGIPALAAWLSLDHQARLRPGESVLVLGATGVVGQVAVQAAGLLGAGRVVAAARDVDALARLEDLGADVTLGLGGADDEGNVAAALEEAAGDGFDVVVDPLYGRPFEMALAATANGARLVTIGRSAGPSADVAFRALQGRTHIGHGNNAVPTSAVRDAYAALTGHAAAGRIRVEIERYPLDRALDAWHAQATGTHNKIVVVP